MRIDELQNLVNRRAIRIGLEGARKGFAEIGLKLQRINLNTSEMMKSIADHQDTKEFIRKYVVENEFSLEDFKNKFKKDVIIRSGIRHKKKRLRKKLTKKFGKEVKFKECYISRIESSGEETTKVIQVSYDLESEAFKERMMQMGFSSRNVYADKMIVTPRGGLEGLSVVDE